MLKLYEHPLFNGERFGWGDLSVYPYVAGSTGHGVAPRADSRLSAWLGRVSQRDSVAQCAAAAMDALPDSRTLGRSSSKGCSCASTATTAWNG